VTSSLTQFNSIIYDKGLFNSFGSLNLVVFSKLYLNFQSPARSFYMLLLSVGWSYGLSVKICLPEFIVHLRL
jgi:hypothetical protein